MGVVFSNKGVLIPITVVSYHDVTVPTELIHVLDIFSETGVWPYMVSSWFDVTL